MICNSIMLLKYVRQPTIRRYSPVTTFVLCYLMNTWVPINLHFSLMICQC
jgi:hypothetical protein